MVVARDGAGPEEFAEYLNFRFTASTSPGGRALQERQPHAPDARSDTSKRDPRPRCAPGAPTASAKGYFSLSLKLIVTVYVVATVRPFFCAGSHFHCFTAATAASARS